MSADDEPQPFDGRMFLPAADDTPSLRMLKYAVIGMGVVLILGLFVIAARIVYLSTRSEASLPVGTGLPAALSLTLPAGGRIETMTLSGNRLALHVTGPGSAARILVYDLASGKVVSQVDVSTGGAPAAAIPGPGKR